MDERSRPARDSPKRSDGLTPGSHPRNVDDEILPLEGRPKHAPERLDPPLTGIGRHIDRRLPVQEALVVGRDLPEIGMIGAAPRGEASIPGRAPRELIDLGKSDANAPSEHEHVGRPAPVLDPTERRVPAVVAGVRGDAIDPARPQPAARRKRLPRPEEMEELLGLALGHVVIESDVPLDDAADRVRPNLAVSAVFGQVGAPSEQRLEGIPAPEVGLQERLAETELAGILGSDGLHGPPHPAIDNTASSTSVRLERAELFTLSSNLHSRLMCPASLPKSCRRTKGRK